MTIDPNTDAHGGDRSDAGGVVTKPHEETWRSEKDCVVGPDETIFIPWDERVGVGPEWQHARDRAQLAAAAPDMARVLLAVEWSGRQDYVGDGGYGCCSCCGGIAPDQESMSDARDDLARGCTVIGHKADCALDAALRKAGVR